ncbi:hypothetical protein CR205_04300 [Alteribacter lacisalsi]|uniref:Uncharacterized protein n=1 Tax=Alteribacter lacisalsi TaxID=2045244 RepID=A0A2W0H7I1_9BACI|nr:hypothetical protein [Alteribacter lacisalsi]PYZ97823.1 hypothetical protein CR205_04300 [Alteribacter lacisalsi]
MKQTFYVSVNQGSRVELFTEKTDPQLIQYEVEIDEKEIEDFRMLIEKFRDKDIEPQQIFSRPFNEPASDREKQELKYDTRHLYELIYENGTEKTRRELEELQKQNSGA